MAEKKLIYNLLVMIVKDKNVLCEVTETNEMRDFDINLFETKGEIENRVKEGDKYIATVISESNWMEIKVKRDFTGLFELKKDIQTPDSYTRAGTIMTKQQWESKFPKCFSCGGNNQWFIDLEELHKENDNESKIDLAWQVVNDLFEKNNLFSISYKSAAVECCKEYLKQINKKDNE